MDSAQVKIIKYQGEPYVEFEDMMGWLRGTATFDTQVGHKFLDAIELSFRRAIDKNEPLPEVMSA